MIWARLVLVMVAVVACKKNDAATAKNKRCAEAAADGKIAEARAWLAPSEDNHLGFEVDKDRMREITEAFYAAGATSVRAPYDDLDGNQISAMLVVDLPGDKTARSALFAKYAELAGEFELDGETDVGQTCLLVALD